MDHDRAPVAGVRVNVLLSRYLIEPCGSGKSKLTYMCRADLRYILIPTFGCGDGDAGGADFPYNSKKGDMSLSLCFGDLINDNTYEAKPWCLLSFWVLLPV